jgi:acetoin:2,6-dichlorophenolindophenol oxidoreductase subunit beta
MPTVLESLNAALHRSLERDERVILLGEDILDPYGGAFKVTRGLSTRFPTRVLATPVSEAGIVGLATGMSLRGLRPVVEIMFGDFITLAADQLINHLAKFTFMYNGQVSVPLVIRTPMGGRRGYGPTHSQSLEKIFLGIPGLRVLAPNTMVDPGHLLEMTILFTPEPVLFIENKQLYHLPVLDASQQSDYELVVSLPQTQLNHPPNGQHAEQPVKLAAGFISDLSSATCQLSVRGAPAPHLTLATYGYMAELARQAVYQLAFEYEIFAELVVPTRLAPTHNPILLDSVSRTGRLLLVEEGTRTMGWGAEVLAQVAETLGSQLIASRRVAARDSAIPAAPNLEAVCFPQVADIVRATRDMLFEKSARPPANFL